MGWKWSDTTPCTLIHLQIKYFMKCYQTFEFSFPVLPLNIIVTKENMIIIGNYIIIKLFLVWLPRLFFLWLQ